MPSYNLLSKLLLRQKSHKHSGFLSELLLIITLTNISNIIRTEQTKHIKDKTETITVTEGFKKALGIVVTLKVITVFKKVKTAANIIY
jgi:hypothetical protein